MNFSRPDKIVGLLLVIAIIGFMVPGSSEENAAEQTNVQTPANVETGLELGQNVSNFNEQVKYWLPKVLITAGVVGLAWLCIPGLIKKGT